MHHLSVSLGYTYVNFAKQGLKIFENILHGSLDIFLLMIFMKYFISYLHLP